MSKTNLKSRLRKLEEAAKADAEPLGQMTEEAWADWFGGTGARLCAAEPDHAEALALLRDAIRDAATSDPPFDPPGDFLADKPPDLRRIEWRRSHSFPKVKVAILWVCEMVRRVLEGKPPVTVAEFRDLEAWFQANRDRVPNNGIKVGENRTLYQAQLRVSLADGPRALRVTELVEDLRRLRKALL